jgi:probable F420-dependent oxidoreductase
MRLSVVVAAREDDSPPDDALAMASLADRLGYRELWIADNPTWDVFALGAVVGRETSRLAVTAGPIPVAVRDPATISRGAASVAALSGRPVGVALGTSSTRMVEGFHGRSRAGAAAVLAASARAVRPLITGEAAEPGEQIVPPQGFGWRLGPAGGPLTIAAFGAKATAVAARYGDRMLLDLVSPEQAGVFRGRLEAAAADAGRPPPPLAAWIPAAVDPAPETLTQIRQSVAGYLTVRGYGEMFTAAGFGTAVEMAQAGAERGEVLSALPPEAVGAVALAGDIQTIRARIEDYAAAGLDEIAIVPATAGDRAGERTLTALAP